MRHSNYTEHFALACMSIKSSLQAVKSFFYGRELYEIHYSFKEEKELLLEIQFEIVKISCLFDDDHICEGVFFLFNSLMDINSYVEHCNKIYPYDQRLNGWVLNNCLIQIYIDNVDSCMLILPIEKRCHKK